MNKLSKRLLSILLSLVMVITAVPAFAVTAQAAATGSADDKLLFAYFCGDDTTSFTVNQKIRLAVSEDGINFSPLNGNLPLLDNTEDGKGINFNGVWGNFAHTGGARDPFIINKRDASGNITAGYYVVATDLCVTSTAHSYNNQKIMVWDIDNLSNIANVKPTVIDTTGMFTEQASMATSSDAIAWAPEVVWCNEMKAYALVWSGPFYTNARINVAFTTDFKKFTTSTGATIDGTTTFAETLYSVSGGYTIDANINYENGKYYMVFKREDTAHKGEIYFAHATTLMGLKDCAATRFYDSVNVGDPDGLEGPEVYKRPDGHWVLIADEYVKNPVCSFAMYDLGTSLEDGLVNKGGSYDHRQDVVSTNINSVYPRHGGMALISNDEYNALNQAYAGYTPSSPGQLVAQYFTTSNVAEDATGHGYTLSTYNGLTTANGIGGRDNVAFFDNGSTNSNSTGAKYASVGTGQMNTGDHTFTAKDGFTFMWDAYDLGTSGGYDAYANLYNLSTYTGSVGNCSYNESDWPQNSYKLSYVTSQLSGGISNGVQSSAGIQRTDGSSPALNGWHSYKAVYSRGGMVVYRDNVKVLAYAMDGINESWVSDVFGTNGRINIGASLFANDKLFNGYISNFRIYNTSNQKNIDKIDRMALSVTPDDINAVGFTPKEANAQIIKYYGDLQIGIEVGAPAVLYTDNAYRDATNHVWSMNGKDNTRMQVKVMAGAGNVVYLYKGGEEDIQVPCIAEYKRTGDTVKGFKVNYLSPDGVNTTDWKVKNNQWKLQSKWNSWTDSTATNYSGDGIKYISGEYGHNATPDFTSNSGEITSGSSMNWYGIIVYKGALNFDQNGMYTLTNPRFNTSIDGYISYWSWGTKEEQYNNVDYKAKTNNTVAFGNNDSNNLPVYRVFNYKPMVDKLAEAKTKFDEVVANDYQYTTDSLEEFYKAVYQLIQYDPTAYDFSKADTVAATATQEMNKLIKAYDDAVKNLVLRQYTIKFVRFGNSAEKVVTRWIWEPLGVFWENTPCEATIKEGKHYAYVWDTAYDSNTEITEVGKQIVINEKSITEDCSGLATCTTRPVCDKCHREFGTALGHSYVINAERNKYVCQHDAGHTKSVDLTVYDETQILCGLVDKSAYKDSAAIDTAKTALDGVIDAAADDTNPQTAIDAAITSMITAINSNNTAEAEKNTYNVKFYVNIDGVSTPISDSNVPYGRVVTLDANATGLVGGVECYSWTVSTGGTERTFSQPGNTRTLLVQADTVVTAYCSTTDRVAKIYNPYNAVLYTVALQVGDTITANGNVVTVTHSGTPTTYIVGSMPYMVVTGFMLDGQEFREAYTVTADTTQVNIKPIVDKKNVGTYTVTLDGNPVATNVAYDTMVTVNSNSPNPYAIAIKLGDGKYAIAAYGGTYSFYANRSVDFCTVTKSGTSYTIDGSTVTDKTLIYKLNNGLPDVYSGHAVTDGANRVTTFNAITVGCNSNSIVILEAGTIYTTGTATEDTFVLGAEGVKQVVAKNIVNPGNQYSLSIGNGRGKGVKTRAYVRYSYTTSKGETVEAITYGNVCVLA